MRRLPNVNQVCAEVLVKAAEAQAGELEKKAAKEPEFTVLVAQLMHKLANHLRAINPNEISLAEVRDFQAKTMGVQNGA